MQELLTEPLSVDEIINLATAYHYFVWPPEREYYGESDTDWIDGSISNSKLTHAVYYASQIKLTPTQTSIFVCHIAKITNPNAFLNRHKYWERQHDQYVLVYQSELLSQKISTGHSVATK